MEPSFEVPPLPSSTADQLMQMLDHRPIDNAFVTNRQKTLTGKVVTIFVSALFVLENTFLAALCFKGHFLNENPTSALITKISATALAFIGTCALFYSWKVCCCSSQRSSPIFTLNFFPRILPGNALPASGDNLTPKSNLSSQSDHTSDQTDSRTGSLASYFLPANDLKKNPAVPPSPINNPTDGNTGLLTVPTALFGNVSPPISPGAGIRSLPSFAAPKTPKKESDKKKTFTPRQGQVVEPF